LRKIVCCGAVYNYYPNIVRALKSCRMRKVWHGTRLRMMTNVYSDLDLFQTANGGFPGGSITTTIQHTNTHVTYTQIQISHKITPLKTNKTKKNKSAYNATQTVKDILQPMNTA
jgi:hypothetical protein